MAISISDFVKSPELQKLYQEWLTSPMTKTVVEMLSALCAPAGLPLADRTGEKALYYAGWTSGQAYLLTLMGSFPTAMVQQIKDTQQLAGLETSYGSESDENLQAVEAGLKGE